ncbi:glycosyl transferase [Raoultella planticola]|uniref:glycosyl transferase n=1 Tax=Raoultella planticola TaxID=575 RepID=UPI001C9E09C9|nr:glycosyl transferase [Raoultella planticola]MDM9678480.1 glycosyl transferase [Raoultella planticola]QZS65875.1 glycosyl transferase [Raoultella planticola]
MARKIIFLIVLFNKNINESTTIKTLLNSNITEVDVIIHNNGPDEILLPLDFFDVFRSRAINVELVNYIQNKPLSILYNEFIFSNPHYDKYILFDDDSVITSSFVEQIYISDYDVLLPKITSSKDNETYYPIVNDVVVTGDKFLSVEGVFSIGSGLILTRTLIDKFFKYSLKPFDENFALYGVDFSLFRRMNILAAKRETFKVKTAGEILHSLSRTEGDESKFRREERLIDFSLTTRHYPSFTQVYRFVKKSIKEILFLRFRNFYVMYDSLLHGTHPRCRQK